MKKIFYLLLSLVAVFTACEKHDYAAGVLSPVTSLEDVRNLYKGSDVAITPEMLNSAHQVVGVVISDFTAGNSPEGVLVIQNNRNKRIRGIAIAIGSTAANYLPGDSLKVNLDGSVLKKINGSLQLTGITDAGIEKLSSGNATAVQSVSTLTVNTNPGLYESTLVMIGGGSFLPAPGVGENFIGDKTLVNGTNSVKLHTEATAAYATELLPLTVNATGIVHLSEAEAGAVQVNLWPRNFKDIVDISDPIIDPVASKYKILITGYVNNSNGGDGNNEYIQLIATEDIDFKKTPFSLITCYNAGAATPNPGAAPGAGWVTGGGRTYKFNLSSGLVKKGEFFYVGGSNKRINGANSTDISSSKWIRAIAYSSNAGDNGVGDKSSGLFPNSGNASGMAIFAGTNIKEDTVPLDVVFFGGTGKTTIVDVANGKGYRIPDNDHYKTIDESKDQPFFYQGTNLYVIPHYAIETGFFVKLGGVFNTTTKTWDTVRGHVNYEMTMTTLIAEIEAGSDVIKLAE